MDNTPLAEVLRPSSIDEIVGQPHLVGVDGALRPIMEGRAELMSLLLWGPPGTGKTTIARLLANREDYIFIEASATSDGVKALREIFERARQYKAMNQQVVLFIDELHSFSRNQQDALLPVVESGLIKLIGATTEHPSFEMQRALLSRLALYVLHPLEEDSLNELMDRVILATQKNISITDEARELFIDLAAGDGRRLISLMERAIEYGSNALDVESIRFSAGEKAARFDHQRDEFYDQISALHKSVRGSDPDAAIYWYARMLEGGADPLYISRRVIRMASEDIGNADPRGLQIALLADQAFRQLGSPEGELVIGQAILYLASTVKSNAAYKAYKAARKAAKETANLEVPKHLKMGSTKIDRQLGHGAGYRYSQDEPNSYSEGQNYFPLDYKAVLYEPSSFGLESKLLERLRALRGLEP